MVEDEILSGERGACPEDEDEAELPSLLEVHEDSDEVGEPPRRVGDGGEEESQ